MGDAERIVLEPLLIQKISANHATHIHQLNAVELSNAEAAIERCTHAAEESRHAADRSGLTAKEARYRSIMAYKLAMPRMDTSDGCIEAVACSVAGMLAGFLDAGEVSRLLYAAQVAQSLIKGSK